MLCLFLNVAPPLLPDVQNLIQKNQKKPKMCLFVFCLKVHGGTDAPYVFVDLEGQSSWDMFSKILEESQIVTIPGAGFGPGGEGFLRLSAFASREMCEEACERLKKSSLAKAPVAA